MSSTKVSPMNDIANVNSIKSKTTQSEGDNTNPGFQESPFKQQPQFLEKDLENILRESQLRSEQGQPYNPCQDNMNISVSSDVNCNLQNGFNKQHTYFQPPIPQYLKSADMNNTTQSLNISQQILDNHKKLSMSPERFYFNPPVIPSKKNSQTKADQEIYKQSDQSQNLQKQNNINSKNASNLKAPITKNNSVQQQTPIQSLQNDRYQQAQLAQSYEFSLQNSHQKFEDQNYTMNEQQNKQNEYQQLNGNSKNSPDQFQYSNQQNIQQNPHIHIESQQKGRIDFQESNGNGEDRLDYNNASGKNRKENAKNNYQNIDYLDDTSSNYNYKTEKKNANNNNQFKNRQSNMTNQSNETKNFEKDLKQFDQQIQFQEEQISHIQISFQKEQLKNRALQDTILELRRKIDSLEIERTEIRSRLLCETEKNVREVQQQMTQVSTLKAKIAELELREDQLRSDTEKSKQNAYKEETNKHKLEDEIRDYKNKIAEMNERDNEYQRRQERRDDEVIQLKLQNEQLKAKLATLSLNNERNTEKVSETQRQQFRDVEEKEDSNRKIGELQQKVQNYLVENERLKNENYNLNRQVHDNNFKNEIIQNDLFNQKQIVLERSQKENILQVNIDKANLEVHQLRNLLSRTEMELRDVKEHNNHLIRNLSDIACQKSGTSQGLYSKQYFVPSSSIIPSPSSEQPYLSSSLIPGYRTQGGLDTNTNTMPQYRSSQQKEENSSQQQQVQSYRRGRMANQLESSEEVKTNFSPGRLRFKPQDHNIFGNSDSGFQARQQEHSWSPGKRAEIQRPRDHNIFGQPADDLYQRNPFKIGHQSLSPQRTRNPWDGDVPAAGMRKRSPRNNPIGISGGFDSIIESGGNSRVGNGEIGTLEDNLMLMNQDRQMLETELRKIEDMKRKTGADLRRKAEISRELEQLENSISQHKMQLRSAGH